MNAETTPVLINEKSINNISISSCNNAGILHQNLHTAVDFRILTDEILVEQYKSGNRNSLSILYERYYKKVYQKCLSFIKDPDEAYDIAQEVLIKTFAKIESFKGKSKFSTWLFAITNNFCIEYFRKYKNAIHESLENYHNLSDVSFDIDESDDIEIREASLQEILEEIPETCKILLLMKYQQSMTIRELQEHLNLSASAVKMRLQRAKQKIENIYNKRTNS